MLYNGHITKQKQKDDTCKGRKNSKREEKINSLGVQRGEGTRKEVRIKKQN
jgi:hypothetical protein